MQRLAPYDVIFMDCQMPEMNGYEATEVIRRREGGERRAIILAMTADVSTTCREQCLQCGMNDYIPKPVKKDAMKAALERWVPAAVPSRI